MFRTKKRLTGNLLCVASLMHGTVKFQDIGGCPTLMLRLIQGDALFRNGSQGSAAGRKIVVDNGVVVVVAVVGKFDALLLGRSRVSFVLVVVVILGVQGKVVMKGTGKFEALTLACNELLDLKRRAVENHDGNKKWEGCG